MLTVLCPKTLMRYAVFLFSYFVDRKTAKRNLFINRTVGNTTKNNTIHRRPIFFGIILQIS